MKKAEAMVESYWLPINLWNLNEIFTTESISPMSFYSRRNFGNPLNRNQQLVEDENNLVLFDKVVQSDILLKISSELLDPNSLTEIRAKGNSKLKSYEYSKTIYFKRGFIKIIFSSQEKSTQFLNNALMLLELKTVSKYREDFIVDDKITESNFKAVYQAKLLSYQNEFEPNFDKAFNQLKGMVYAYLIGLIGTLGEKEQGLISELLDLKNVVGSVHTDLVLGQQYSNLWLTNIRRKIIACSKSYISVFGMSSDVFETLILRLEEVDKLNRMRFDDLEKQQNPNYKIEFKKAQEDLEKVKRKLYKFEYNNEILSLKQELEAIKRQEERRGELKGRKREYYKKGSQEYIQKQNLKKLIEDFEQDPNYKQLKQELEKQEEYIRNFQFGFTQYDTSITEQFSRISDYLHDTTKKATAYFLAKNNRNKDFANITFKIDIEKLSKSYARNHDKYNNITITLPEPLTEILNPSDIDIAIVALNTILLNPQGLLGDYSEQSVLNIIKSIGEQISESNEKQILREYYLYRVGKAESFSFPTNVIMANLIGFLMKLNGHEQLNKLLVSKGVANKQIAFMFYGAYMGFANMPKTFTNIIFESNNIELFDYVDDYFSGYFNKPLFDFAQRGSFVTE